MRFCDFSKRNIAIKIYSEILDCELWLCSTESMESQIKQDDPSAITYTTGEMKRLIELNLTPEELQNIHNGKNVFNSSKIVDSMLKRGGSNETRD